MIFDFIRHFLSNFTCFLLNLVQRALGSIIMDDIFKLTIMSNRMLLLIYNSYFTLDKLLKLIIVEKWG